jgi:hypothetical protein
MRCEAHIPHSNSSPNAKDSVKLLKSSTNMKPTLEPNQIIELAINGQTKEVALKLGKSVSYLYKMEQEAESCRYTRLLQLYYALPVEGQALLFEDFRSRHRANQHAHVLRGTDWADAIGDVAKETAEAICAAVKNKNRKEVVREATDAIRSLQYLLELARADEELPAK